MKKYFISLSVLLIFCGLVSAQESDERVISVTGKSTVTVDAERIVISIETYVLRDQMDKSYTDATKLSTELIDKLIAAGLSADNIKKSIVKLGQKYEYENRQKLFKGYYSRLTMILTIDELQLLPQVYRILAGYNDVTIQSTKYKIKDPFTVRQTQFEKAARAAKEKAQHMATLLGAKLGKVKTISEVSPQTYVNKSIPYNTARIESTGVEFGSVTITATVYVEFYLE